MAAQRAHLLTPALPRLGTAPSNGTENRTGKVGTVVSCPQSFIHYFFSLSSSSLFSTYFFLFAFKNIPLCLLDFLFTSFPSVLFFVSLPVTAFFHFLTCIALLPPAP